MGSKGRFASGQAVPALQQCAATLAHGEKFAASLGSLALLGQAAACTDTVHCYARQTGVCTSAVPGFARAREAEPQPQLCRASRRHGESFIFHIGFRVKKKEPESLFANQAPKRNPASNYSPTVKYAVPSSLGPLSIVFGMGT